MMARIFLIISALSTIVVASIASASEENVINYYAVDNSLDGQPFVNLHNILKFFPVFAIRDSVKEVKVSIDYGLNQSSAPRNSDKVDDGRFWRVSLPKFKLGEAIQRIEVEVTFNIANPFIEKMNSLNAEKKRLEIQISDVNRQVMEQGSRQKDISDSISRLGVSIDSLREIEKNQSVFIARKDTSLAFQIVIEALKKRTSADTQKDLSGTIQATADLQKALSDSLERRDSIATLLERKKRDSELIKANQDTLRRRMDFLSSEIGMFEFRADSLQGVIKGLKSKPKTENLPNEKRRVDAVAESLRAIEEGFYEVLRDQKKKEKDLTAKIDTLTAKADSLDALIKAMKLKNACLQEISSKIRGGKTLDEISTDVRISDSNLTVREDLKRLEADLERIRKKPYDLQNNLYERQKALSDSIKKISSDLVYFRTRLETAVSIGLTDTAYVGPGVKKSDLRISEDFKSARMLYRNYNHGLRHLKTLDPAERLGIFRLRYVPFPIVGTKDKPEMHLIPPGESPAVFEVGLAFGNDIIAGDRDFIGDFSFRKFGISFAVTKELFSKNAEIIGILLNYDFNPYASLGFGGNFAHGKIRKYASFGINKRAFEEVVKGLIALFQ